MSFIKKETLTNELDNKFYIGEKLFLYDDIIVKIFKIDNVFVASEKFLNRNNEVMYNNYYFDTYPTEIDIRIKIARTIFKVNEFEIMQDVKSITRNDIKDKEKRTNYYTTIEFNDGEKIVFHSVYVDHFGMVHNLKNIEGSVWKDGTLRDFVESKGWKVIRELSKREMNSYLIVKSRHHELG